MRCNVLVNIAFVAAAVIPPIENENVKKIIENLPSRLETIHLLGFTSEKLTYIYNTLLKNKTSIKVICDTNTPPELRKKFSELSQTGTNTNKRSAEGPTVLEPNKKPAPAIQYSNFNGAAPKVPSNSGIPPTSNMSFYPFTDQDIDIVSKRKPNTTGNLTLEEWRERFTQAGGSEQQFNNISKKFSTEIITGSLVPEEAARRLNKHQSRNNDTTGNSMLEEWRRRFIAAGGSQQQFNDISKNFSPEFIIDSLDPEKAAQRLNKHQSRNNSQDFFNLPTSETSKPVPANPNNLVISETTTRFTTATNLEQEVLIRHSQNTHVNEEDLFRLAFNAINADKILIKEEPNKDNDKVTQESRFGLSNK